MLTFEYFRHSFVTTTLLLLGRRDSEWKLPMRVGKSTVKTPKLLPCHPALQQRGNTNVGLQKQKGKEEKSQNVVYLEIS